MIQNPNSESATKRSSSLNPLVEAGMSRWLGKSRSPVGTLHPLWCPDGWDTARLCLLRFFARRRALLGCGWRLAGGIAGVHICRPAACLPALGGIRKPSLIASSRCLAIVFFESRARRAIHRTPGYRFAPSKSANVLIVSRTWRVVGSLGPRSPQMAARHVFMSETA